MKEENKVKVKGVLYFLLIALYAVAVIGGIGQSIFMKQYAFVAEIVFLGALAFPAVKKIFQSLREGK